MNKNLLKALVTTITLSTSLTAFSENKEMTGKQITENTKLGNCLACHMVWGGDQPGNIAGPLVAMKARYPDIAMLKAQISDPRINNKDTMMPLFGAFEILTPEQLDKVTDYIYSL